MAKSSKQKRRDEGIFFGLLEIIDFMMNFLPGKALTALVIVGAVGGAVGYDMGVGSSEIPECPTCPEQILCPEPEPCPVCKELGDYTDEELIEALKPAWICYPNDEVETG
ncbi:MAG: hypothetical protein QF460_02365 [Candidatus Nanoarchaeia archaeon]|jgi:hypothetical protein|nr:hypothetical protein [Candidatus Nanoarchaeia archaeon]|tara:strand:- start:243 stop:572 length:330 start_codon:yes stop_codon:yes gene_type:complete